MHTARGVELAGRRRFREAIEAFREAVRLIPDNAVARSNLGMTLARAGAVHGEEGQLAEAIEEFRVAIRLQPGAVVLYQHLAAALALADRIRDSLAVLDEALRLDPGDAKSRALRSVAHLALGDFEQGWPDFAMRLVADPSRRVHELPGVPLWRGETLAGALLINAMAEGQGDCIQAIRFAVEARRRVGSTVVMCPTSLARLLERCEGVDRVATAPAGVPAVQAQIGPMYLAAAFRPTPDTMWSNAYLSADPAERERWRPAVESIPGMRIGIAWQGNPEHGPDASRSFRLAEAAPLAGVSGVSLISLQKGHGAEQRAEVSFPVIDLGREYADGDWHRTAAVAGHLDLVIAPDTAVAHLAGSMGRPTWLALGRPPEWRWMEDREDSPWYPTMRLFRQDRIGDWGAVFRRMAEALGERAR
jgi:hypothetical protein